MRPSASCIHQLPLRLLAFTLSVASFGGCRTESDGSEPSDDLAVSDREEAGTINAGTRDDLSLEPVTTRIVVAPGDTPIPVPFENHEAEYWLMDEVGESTGYVAGVTGGYRPHGAECPAGDHSCELQPSEAARRCLKQSSDTLKEIEANPPQAWVAFQEKYGHLRFQGWLNDYSTSAKDTSLVRGRIWHGPFNWQSHELTLGDPDFSPAGTIKWASAIYPDGTCKTPSKGLFLRLLRLMEQCSETPGPGCCGEALPHDANAC